MNDPWQVLQDAGMPIGAARPKPSAPLDGEEIREALRSIVDSTIEIEPGRLEPLLAWLRGGFHHWPHRFAEVLGPDGARVRDLLWDRFGHVIDQNRYLKLRRIAIENLSGVL